MSHSYNTPGIESLGPHHLPAITCPPSPAHPTSLPAGSPTLRSLLCDMPALGRTLTHPDSPPLVLEMSKAPILVQLLAAHRRSVRGACMDVCWIEPHCSPAMG